MSFVHPVTMIRFIILSFLISQSWAQTCDPLQSTGPSLDGVTCPAPGQVVDANGICCPSTAIQLPTTTAAATTVATTIVTDSSGGSTQVGVTSVTSSVTSTSSTTCVDRLNPSTGVSDCPARAALCNDATYYTVMTQQCPRTCGRCSSTTSSTGCVDRVNPSSGVSDCPARAALCNDATYYTIMTAQCPRTCGRCNSTSTSTTSSTTCVDLTNPSTGVSDCPSRVALCTNSAYTTLMRTQCPRTCGFCSSSSTVTSATSTVTSSSTCADLINPNTGTSDCPGIANLCTNSAYSTLMRTQCRLTCGFCSG